MKEGNDEQWAEDDKEEDEKKESAGTNSR